MSAPSKSPTALSVIGSKGTRRLLTAPALLGGGEASEVYSVEQEGQRFVLKVSREGFERHLENEARLHILGHGTAIARLHDVVLLEREGRTSPALLLEYCAGTTLAVAMASGEPLPSVARRVLEVVGRTLREFALLGYRHGDIKPENILVLEDGDIRVLDFGLARRVGEPAEGGTLRYLPPEIKSGARALVPTSDSFALALVLAELVVPELRTTVALGEVAFRSPLLGEKWPELLPLLEPDPARRAGLDYLFERDAPQTPQLVESRLRRNYVRSRLEEITLAFAEGSRPVSFDLTGLARDWLEEPVRLEEALAKALHPKSEELLAPLVITDLGRHERARFLARVYGPELGLRRARRMSGEPDEVWLRTLQRDPEEGDEEDESIPASTIDWVLRLRRAPVSRRLLARAAELLGTEPLVQLEIARCHRRAGRFSEALSTLEGATSGRLLLERAVCLGRAGAVRESEELLLELKESDLEEVRAAARAQLARRCLDRRDFSAARKLLPDDSREACLHEVWALLHLSEGQGDKASRAIVQGLFRARDDEEEARLLGIRGMLEHQEGEPGKALTSFSRAAELAERAGARLEQATYLTGFSAAASDLSNLSEGLRAAEHAEILFESLGREKELARVLLSRVAILAQVGACPEAVLTAQRGRNLALRHDDLRCAGYFELSLADVLLERQLGLLAAERARGLLAGFASDALRAEARILQYGGVPKGLGDDDARRTEQPEARAEWWRARAQRLREERREDGAQEVLDGLDVSLLELRSPRELGLCRVAQSDLLLLLGRSMDAQSALRDAGAHATAFLLSVPEDFRPRAGALDWVVRARSSGPEAVDGGAQLADVSKLLRSLSRGEGLGPLLRQVLDALLLWTGVERGLLLLRAPGGRLSIRAARNLKKADLSPEQLSLSRTLAERALAEGRAIALVDAFAETSELGRSVHALALRSVLAVPLQARGQTLGVAYLDDRTRRAAFGKEQLAWAELIATIAALAIHEERDRLDLRRALGRARRAEGRLGEELSTKELELEKAEALLRARPGRLLTGNYSKIVGRGAKMLELLSLVERVAKSDVPVLVIGESGTGKELIARALADNGPRKERPFVAENCAAVPESLLESALFGHVRGAFTGAVRARAGLFEVADGGTLFLDEIGEMSLGMQTKLLRILQTGELRPVGAEKSRQVSVRVIAATHRDLSELVQRGLFREDLYYRLSVVPLRVPPLRERVEDIAPLIDHFLRVYGGSKSFPPAVQGRLLRYPWPGNVRQLENEVRRLLVLGGDEVTVSDLSAELRDLTPELPSGSGLHGQVDALSRRLILEALEEFKGNRTRAAERLGLSRFGLQKMIDRLGLEGDYVLSKPGRKSERGVDRI